MRKFLNALSIGLLATVLILSIILYNNSQRNTRIINGIFQEIVGCSIELEETFNNINKNEESDNVIINKQISYSQQNLEHMKDFISILDQYEPSLEIEVFKRMIGYYADYAKAIRNNKLNTKESINDLDNDIEFIYLKLIKYHDINTSDKLTMDDINNIFNKIIFNDNKMPYIEEQLKVTGAYENLLRKHKKDLIN